MSAGCGWRPKFNVCCKSTLPQALAELYRLQPSIADAAAEADAQAAAGGSDGQQQLMAHEAAGQRRRQREWTVQHVLLPALR